MLDDPITLFFGVLAVASAGIFISIVGLIVAWRRKHPKPIKTTIIWPEAHSNVNERAREANAYLLGDGKGARRY